MFRIRGVTKAEELLAKRETKKARESIRIGSKKAQEFLDRLTDLGRTQPNDEDARIFPPNYAPVLISEAGRTIIRPMPYACRLAGKPADYDKRFAGTYKARHDSLHDYRRELYGRNHAVMVINGFYKNVSRSSERAQRDRTGRKAEEPRIRVRSDPAQDMLIACLWDHWTHPREPDLYSFAAITADRHPKSRPPAISERLSRFRSATCSIGGHQSNSGVLARDPDR